MCRLQLPDDSIEQKQIAPKARTDCVPLVRHATQQQWWAAAVLGHLDEVCSLECFTDSFTSATSSDPLATIK